ncbi:MAG: hypothetical protein QNJ92_09310 [Alphaproteobacteria bacterium]|nr:hypothetical protein [Alphaproteobacteria bacterium]
MTQSDPNGGTSAPPIGTYRIILWVQVVDFLAGFALFLVADQFDVPGTVAGLPVLEFVGLALMVIGVVGLIVFGVLAQSARRRWERSRSRGRGPE